MTQLFAQPYDISASGFYFSSFDEFQSRAALTRNDFGFPVEEYEIQFIDGDSLDAHLFEALGVNQANIGAFLEACENWNIEQKQKAIIAVGECGYTFDLKSGDPDDFDVDLYEMNNLRELAEHFVEEGLFGEIPKHLQNYLDHDAIARDLGMDYAEITLVGKRLIYRSF